MIRMRSFIVSIIRSTAFMLFYTQTNQVCKKITAFSLKLSCVRVNPIRKPDLIGYTKEKIEDGGKDNSESDDNETSEENEVSESPTEDSPECIKEEKALRTSSENCPDGFVKRTFLWWYIRGRKGGWKAQFRTICFKCKTDPEKCTSGKCELVSVGVPFRQQPRLTVRTHVCKYSAEDN